MKLETSEEAKKPPRRKRGPRPKQRLGAFDAAYLLHRMGVKSLGYSDVCAATGWSVNHAKNVLGGARGLSEMNRSRLVDLLGSPFGYHSPLLDPAQLPWFDLIPYGPLLSSRTPPLGCQPAAHVSIDKLVLTGKLAARERLCRHLPLFDADPEVAGAFFYVSTWHGRIKAFWERSEMDNTRKIKPWKRYLRFWRTVNLKAFVEGEWCTIAKLSIEPFRKRCKMHRGGETVHFQIPCDSAAHGEECPADHFHYVRPDNFRCPDCLSLTKAQPTYRFEMTGLGCTLGLHTSLTQSHFTPFVDRVSVKIDDIHIAVDIDAPAGSLLPFQCKQEGNRGFRNVLAHDNDADRGLSFGSSSRPFSVVVYDKKHQVAEFRHRMYPHPCIEPNGTSGFGHICRIEFRFRPERLGLDAAPERSFPEALLDLIGTLEVADLHHLDSPTPLAQLLSQARMKGFIARTPSPKAAVDLRVSTSSDDLRKLHFGPWLTARLRAAGMKRKSIEKAVPVLHAAVLAELMRLSAATPIDLRAIVETELPRLQAELDACLSAPSGFMHMPAPSHHARSPENAAQGPRRTTGSEGHESLIDALCGPS